MDFVSQGVIPTSAVDPRVRRAAANSSPVSILIARFPGFRGPIVTGWEAKGFRLRLA